MVLVFVQPCYLGGIDELSPLSQLSTDLPPLSDWTFSSLNVSYIRGYWQWPKPNFLPNRPGKATSANHWRRIATPKPARCRDGGIRFTGGLEMTYRTR
jgi:hypothetical protein